MALAAAAFAIATYGALYLASASSQGAQLWLGPGLLAGLLLISQARHRAWYAWVCLVSAGTVYWLCGDSPGSALVRVVIAIAEAFAVLWLLRANHAWIDGLEDSLGSWLRFIVAGIIVVPLLGALPGGWLISADQGVNLSTGFRLWYGGHAMSMCVMVPLLLRIQRRQIDQLIEKRRVVETLFWFAAFAVVAGTVFAQSSILPLFLLMPLLVITVFRAGFLGLALGGVVLGLAATFSLHAGSSPLLSMAAGTDWWVANSLAQLFVILVFGTMVLIAALFEERRAHEAVLEASNLELIRMATTDALTGIPNRRWFDAEMASAWANARRESISVGLLLIDIDHFKRYNDHYGHAAGDACLKDVAAILQRETRPTDQCARYGGEEFVVILPGASAEDARRVGDRLCHAVQNAVMPHAESEFGVVTVSIGAAAAEPDDYENKGLFGLSDRALYNAKRSGRNRTMAE